MLYIGYTYFSMFIGIYKEKCNIGYRLHLIKIKIKIKKYFLNCNKV